MRESVSNAIAKFEADIDRCEKQIRRIEQLERQAEEQIEQANQQLDAMAKEKQAANDEIQTIRGIIEGLHQEPAAASDNGSSRRAERVPARS